MSEIKVEIEDIISKLDVVENAEEFHRKVYEERKVFLNLKKDAIQIEMKSLNDNIEALSSDIYKIGAIISTNEVYQESIELYEKYNSDLRGLKYKQGKLSQVKEIDNFIEAEDTDLTNSFNQANYDNDVNSYFDIKVRSKQLRSRPIVFEFTLKGDTGEGVGEVKKNLMDFLICRYNTYQEIMIQDSSCFNGIDPRQVAGMLSQLNKIAEESNKQIIIAINKYQLGDYETDINMVEKNSVITLSENDNLLGFEF